MDAIFDYIKKLKGQGKILTQQLKTGLPMLNRKQFIRNAALSAGAMLAGPTVMDAASALSPVRLTILHTNDTHSRLEPFPMDGGRNQGLGGIAGRTSLINQIRKEEEHVLLLDAGDIFRALHILIYTRGAGNKGDDSDGL